jgi:acyl-CoA synthetase (AMP-forming)/AMP-acid ligase II
MQEKPFLINHFLERSAQAHPGRIAVVHGDVRMSYEDLDKRANGLAQSLVSLGMKPGDRCVLLCENRVEFIIAYYGIFKAGGIAAPLSPDEQTAALSKVLASLQPAMVIVSQRAFDALLPALPPSCRALVRIGPPSPAAGPVPSVSFNEASRALSRLDTVAAAKADDVATIVFTSGSTGTPKGVMLTHENTVANTGAIVDYLHLTHHDIQMVVLPFFYVYGTSLLNTHIAAGGELVINNNLAYPATVVQMMIDEKVTGFAGVPATYAHMVHRSPLARFRESLGSLRYCTQAGGHMAVSLKRQLRTILPDHVALFIMYGATEATARITYLPPERLLDKIESIGIPLSGIVLAIRDESGQPVPPGEVGELVVRGPNIMRGYWQDPEATDRVLDKHGYHTGDLGYADHEGFLYVVGRKDSQVKVGGVRINPQEVENALLDTGLIIEAAVGQVADAMLAHALCAVVVTREAATTEQDIRKALGQLLDRRKVPSHIILAPHLLKTATGKIDRTKTIQTYGAQNSGGIPVAVDRAAAAA